MQWDYKVPRLCWSREWWFFFLKCNFKQRLYEYVKSSLLEGVRENAWVSTIRLDMKLGEKDGSKCLELWKDHFKDFFFLTFSEGKQEVKGKL